MSIIEKLYQMTAIQEIVNGPGTILMLVIGALLLYLGIKKKYEPLLLIPIAFGLILANLPGGGMAVVSAENIQIDEHHYKNL